jgi:hypothetical protein
LFVTRFLKISSVYLCPRDGILQGGELRNELSWLVLLRDGRVLGRERVAVEAEVAHPQLRTEIHLEKRISTSTVTKCCVKHASLHGLNMAGKCCTIFVKMHAWMTKLASEQCADPGSGAFLTPGPGSGIRSRFFPDPGSRIPDPKPIFLRAQ